MGHVGEGLIARKVERLLENCVFGFDSAATTACVIHANYSKVATRLREASNNSRLATSDQKEMYRINLAVLNPLIDARPR